MFLSIITPTFNSEKTILNTLKSVAKQDFKNYEHIIIDNLSSDKTIQIIKKFNNKKVKILIEKDNGIYEAMNKGALISEGKYLLFLNSDDTIIDKSFFKKVFLIIKKKKVDILYTNIKYKPNFFGIIRKYYSGDHRYNKNKLGWHPPHPGTIIKKFFFYKIGMFSVNYKISADFDFFIKSQRNILTKFYYLNNFAIEMSLGGASSGFINVIKSNLECYKSLKKNNINYPIFFITVKILIKFLQYFK